LQAKSNKDVYDICYPYTDVYFRSLLEDSSEVLISAFTSNNNKTNFTDFVFWEMC